MKTYNQITILGYSTEAATLRYLPSKLEIGNVTLTTVNSTSEFHKIVFYGEKAKDAAKSIEKGDLVFAVGELKSREFKGSDGYTRKVTEVIVSAFSVVSKKSMRQDHGRLVSMNSVEKMDSETLSDMSPYI